MRTSSKWMIGIAVALAIVAGGRVVAYALAQPTDVEITGNTDDPEPEPMNQDRIIAGYVDVTPEKPNTLTVDEIQILTGPAAHDAAVEAGVIEDGEDLPNDMWIDNSDTTTVDVSLAPDASLELISAVTPGDTVSVTFADLVALDENTYTGAPVYGVVPGEPVLMDITINGSVATSATAVYQP